MDEWDWLGEPQAFFERLIVIATGLAIFAAVASIALFLAHYP